MIEIRSPLIAEQLARTAQDSIVVVLTARFGKVPREMVKRLRVVAKDKELKVLLRFAVSCPDLAVFRERLLS
jgi:hypothetical protein